MSQECRLIHGLCVMSLGESVEAMFVSLLHTVHIRNQDVQTRIGRSKCPEICQEIHRSSAESSSDTTIKPQKVPEIIRPVTSQRAARQRAFKGFLFIPERGSRLRWRSAVSSEQMAYSPRFACGLIRQGAGDTRAQM